MAPLPPGILVLGMHRSGTSARSRVLNLLGATLGDDLMPAVPGNNEAGFWEHRPILLEHERLLADLNRAWDSVLPLPPGWLDAPATAAARDRLETILSDDFAAARLWGLKDPRLCRVVPLWRRMLAADPPRCVLIVRHPAEVARSLAARDGMPASQAHLLWLRSLAEAERDSRGLRRSVTSFDALMADWRTTVARIGRELDVEWPTSPDAAAAEVDAFLSPSLRHQRADAAADLPPLVARLYAAALTDDLSSTVDAVLAELDRDPTMLAAYVADADGRAREAKADADAEAKRVHDDLYRWQQEAKSAHAQLGDERAQALARHALLTGAEDEANRLRVDRDRWHAEAVAAHALLGDERAQAAARHALLTDARARAGDVSDQLAAARGSVASLEAELADRAAALFAASDVGRMAGEAAAAAREDAAHARLELDAYRVQRAALLAVAGQVWRSRSWRWTAPFRRLARKPLTADDLAPVGPIERLGNGRWRSPGRAEFVLPCLPACGRVRIRLRMTCDAGATAVLYFDTGRLFNAAESIDLGTSTGGRLDADRTVTLAAPVHCFRLDPVQVAAEFHIEAFEIVPA